jgi:hypothetical protein
MTNQIPSQNYSSHSSLYTEKHPPWFQKAAKKTLLNLKKYAPGRPKIDCRS